MICKKFTRRIFKIDITESYKKNHEKIGFNVSLPKLINFRSKNVLNFINKNSKIYKFVKKI